MKTIFIIFLIATAINVPWVDDHQPVTVIDDTQKWGAINTSSPVEPLVLSWPDTDFKADRIEAKMMVDSIPSQVVLTNTQIRQLIRGNPEARRELKQILAQSGNSLDSFSLYNTNFGNIRNLDNNEIIMGFSDTLSDNLIKLSADRYRFRIVNRDSQSWLWVRQRRR